MNVSMDEWMNGWVYRWFVRLSGLQEKALVAIDKVTMVPPTGIHCIITPLNSHS
jgi:isoleucyl-tRNA synthetase